MIETLPGIVFSATLVNAPVGLVGQLSFKVRNLDDDTDAITARTTGITESIPGSYTTTDIAPATPGDYLVVWELGALSVTEELNVGGVEDTTYCTVDDVRSYAPELQMIPSGDIKTAILKAQRDMDWYSGFGGTPNDVSGLRFDPIADLDSPVRNALRRATCAQAQYRCYMGEAYFTDEVQYSELSGDQGTKRPRRVGPQARSEFPRSLIINTGSLA